MTLSNIPRVLCDAGLTARLDSDKIEFYYKNSLVLSGVRDETTGGLWMIDLPVDQHVAMNIYPTGTIAKLVAFYHGCFCYPSISTFKKVLTLGTQLPGIDIKNVNKYPPITPAKAAGHLDGTRWVRDRHGLKQQLVEIRATESAYEPLTSNVINSSPRGQYVFVSERPLMTNLVHEDSMGAHPTPSRSGNTYILFMYARRCRLHPHGTVSRP